MRHIVFRIAKFPSHFFYLVYKKGGKLWQSVVITLVEGINVLGIRCSTELTAFQSFPASFSFS